MTISTEGMAEVKNLLKVTVEKASNLRPVMEEAANAWAVINARSFARQASPDGRAWAPRKEDGGRAGIRSGAMAAGQSARALSHSVQGLTAPYYSVFFKSGAVMGNRLAGLRKKKADRLRRRRRARGTSRQGGTFEVQPERRIAPIEMSGSSPLVLDDDYFELLQGNVARFLASKEWAF